jgi:PBSX family phage terminase large subunit
MTTKRGKKKLSKEQAIAQLWEIGDLSYKLKGIQKDMRDKVYESEHDITIFLCSRQTGKSFTMCLIASEYCQKNPNTRVVLMFPKKNMANSVAKEQMRIIHEDCPDHLKPELKVADKEFVYPNGSVIMMAGADGGHAEAVRGKTVHLTLCDEAGFFPYNDMLYIVNSILMPTMTTTDGKMIIASTPSKEPDHPFLTNFVDVYRANEWLVEYDINSNPLIDEKTKAKIVKRYPLGEEDPEYQREYLLKTRVSNSLMVVPEWHDIEDDVVKAAERPIFADNYVAIDPAVVDGTGIIFGYYDYKRDKLVIEDELFLGGDGTKSLTTQEIADGITRKENNLFRNPYTGEINEPYMRISDNNLPLLINDLATKHNIRFRTTKKDGKEDKVNQVRMLMKRGKLEIHPRCKNLIDHIRTAKWEKSRKKFVRNKGDMTKKIKPNHSDLLDALVYLVRNYHPHRNPYPEGYYDLKGESAFSGRNYEKPNENKDLMKAIMNLRKK